MVQLGSVTVCLRFYLTPLLILDDIELEQPVLPEDPDSRPKDFPPLPYSIHLYLVINKASVLILRNLIKRAF